MENLVKQDSKPVPKPRLVILGGGAIGSVIAAALAAKPGLEPLLVGRRDHVRAINEHGLQAGSLFSGPLFPKAREEIDFPLDDTLLIVTVKAVDLAASLKQLSPWLRPTTSLLLLQNGYGIKELALETLTGLPVPAANVFIGIVAMGATLVAPGEVTCRGGNVRVEPAFSASPFFAGLQGLAIKVEASRDIRRDLWTKLLVNAVLNPLSVLLQARNLVVAQERFDGLKAALLEEGNAVAAAEGVEIMVDAPFINRFITSDNATSMLQDFWRGRASEIDFINGSIVGLGKKHGLPTPVNAFVVSLIKALEALPREQKPWSR